MHNSFICFIFAFCITIITQLPVTKNIGITPVSNEAFAVLAECEETRKPFGITIDPKGRDLRFVWAFKIDRSKAQREGFASHSVNGTISLDVNFNGCPHCGSKRFYICDNCKTIVCWHGQERVTCPHCHNTGTIYTAESFSLKGGGF